VSVSLLCLVPLICYIIYLIGLQDDSIMLVRIFGIHMNIRGQIRILYTIGSLEIGVFGVGLAISASSYYIDGSIDRRILTYTLMGILFLISIIAVGLNIYYQYMVSQLGL